jgi:hypothetical protein
MKTIATATGTATGQQLRIPVRWVSEPPVNIRIKQARWLPRIGVSLRVVASHWRRSSGGVFGIQFESKEKV